MKTFNIQLSDDIVDALKTKKENDPETRYLSFERFLEINLEDSLVSDAKFELDPHDMARIINETEEVTRSLGYSPSDFDNMNYEEFVRIMRERIPKA